MRHAPRLLAVLGIVALPAALLSGLAGAGASPAAASASFTPSWTPPVRFDSGGAEPGIKIPPDGRSAAYVTAPGPSGSNFWRVKEAVDSAGNTRLTGTPGVQPDGGTGGGDAEISVGTGVDPSTGCAPIAYSGLHNIDLLDNFTVATSTDCGQTFSLLNPYATQNTLTDRQWQTFDGIKTTHLLYHKVDTGQIVDSRSEDGGRTYVTLGTPSGTLGVIDAAHAYTLPNVKIGNVVTDLSRPVAGQTYPISGEHVHTLWATFVAARDASDAAAAAAPVSNGPPFNYRDTVYVGRSDDGGLTWTDTTSFSTLPTETRELDLIFPVIAVDKAGNLYSAWTDGNLVQYVSSTDGGKTWTKPYTLDPGEPGARTSGGTANLFPWIAAGGNGRLDVVWYHGQGGDTTGYRNVGTNGTKWTVAFAQLFNATAHTSSGTPTPTLVQRNLAASPVLHTGNVCNNGTTCGITDNGDRTLLDFFQVAIDGQGRANIAYADDQGSAKTAHVEYIRQNSGRSLLTGAPVVPNRFAPVAACSPTGVFTDAAGDATGAALVASTPTPSQDDLDVLKAYFTTKGSGRSETLTSHVVVKSLGSVGGQYFRFYFSYGSGAYLTIASRSVAGVTAYSLDSNGLTGASSLKTITGSFDAARNQVTATFSLADFNATAKPQHKLADGGSLGGLQVLAQRNTGAVTLTSDTATATCPYIVGSDQARAGGRSGSGPLQPATGQLPRTGPGLALPVAGLAVLLTVLFAMRRSASRR